jgi:RNase H-fold protein (predicted Holliday junction resolvase)
MALLGIDYGTAKLGFAIADSRVAAPLRVVRYTNRGELRDALRVVCEDYDVRTIVVGVPRDPEVVAGFLEWLRREVSVPVLTEDEQLTTVFAQSLMRGWKEKADDDAIAAALILQSYLERTAL